MKGSALAALLVVGMLLFGPAASHAAAATCAGSTGPGIPPPASLPSGLPGFHAQWYGQSGYPTLCPGQRSAATVAYYNSGSLGWVSGKLGEVGRDHFLAAARRVHRRDVGQAQHRVAPAQAIAQRASDGAGRAGDENAVHEIPSSG